MTAWKNIMYGINTLLIECYLSLHYNDKLLLLLLEESKFDYMPQKCLFDGNLSVCMYAF